jgi:hypothetical protein
MTLASAWRRLVVHGPTSLGQRPASAALPQAPLAGTLNDPSSVDRGVGRPGDRHILGRAANAERRRLYIDPGHRRGGFLDNGGSSIQSPVRGPGRWNGQLMAAVDQASRAPARDRAATPGDDRQHEGLPRGPRRCPVAVHSVILPRHWRCLQEPWAH